MRTCAATITGCVEKGTPAGGISKEDLETMMTVSQKLAKGDSMSDEEVATAYEMAVSQVTQSQLRELFDLSIEMGRVDPKVAQAPCLI
jgi:hypothetical protein